MPYPQIDLDRVANYAHVRLSNEAIAHTVHLTDSLLVDVDALGMVVGIEVLDLAAEIPFPDPQSFCRVRNTQRVTHVTPLPVASDHQTWQHMRKPPQPIQGAKHMSMERAEFEAIASAINEAMVPAKYAGIMALDIADRLCALSSRFDPQRFIEQVDVGIAPETVSAYSHALYLRTKTGTGVVRANKRGG